MLLVSANRHGQVKYCSTGMQTATPHPLLSLLASVRLHETLAESHKILPETKDSAGDVYPRTTGQEPVHRSLACGSSPGSTSARLSSLRAFQHCRSDLVTAKPISSNLHRWKLGKDWV